MNIWTHLTKPFQKEKKFPFCKIHLILSRTDVFSTDAYITILILSKGAVTVLETKPEIPPETNVIKTDGSTING